MKLTLNLCLIGWTMLFLAACDSGGGISMRTILSPDKAYTAVVITEIGGGIGGSSCIDTVAVISGKTAPSVNFPETSKAYVGGCHQLEMTTVNGQPVIPNGPQVSWTEPHELHIIFNQKLAQQGVSEFYSVTSLYNGAVAIHNEPQ